MSRTGLSASVVVGVSGNTSNFVPTYLLLHPNSQCHICYTSGPVVMVARQAENLPQSERARGQRLTLEYQARHHSSRAVTKAVAIQIIEAHSTASQHTTVATRNDIDADVSHGRLLLIAKQGNDVSLGKKCLEALGKLNTNLTGYLVQHRINDDGTILELVTNEGGRANVPASHYHQPLQSSHLHMCAEVGWSNLFAQLLTSFNWNIRNSFQQTIMHAAAQGGSIDIAKAVQQESQDLFSELCESVDMQLRTPLMYAAMNNRVTFVEFLLEFIPGISLLRRDTSGFAALDYAIFVGNPHMVKRLIARGAQYNFNVCGFDACTLAMIRGHARGHFDHIRLSNMYDLLCELCLRCSPNRISQLKDTQLLKVACENNDLAKFLEVMDDNDWKSGEQILNDMTLLHYAVYFNSEIIANHLLEDNADCNATDAAGFTPLHYAARNNNDDLCRLLLDRGSDVTVESHSFQSPLSLMIEMGLNDVVELVLITYPDCAQYCNGRTLETYLHVAIRAQNLRALLSIKEGTFTPLLTNTTAAGTSAMDYCREMFPQALDTLIPATSPLNTLARQLFSVSLEEEAIHHIEHVNKILERGILSPRKQSNLTPNTLSITSIDNDQESDFVYVQLAPTFAALESSITDEHGSLKVVAERSIRWASAHISADHIQQMTEDVRQDIGLIETSRRLHRSALFVASVQQLSESHLLCDHPATELCELKRQLDRHACSNTECTVRGGISPDAIELVLLPIYLRTFRELLRAPLPICYTDTEHPHASETPTHRRVYVEFIPSHEVTIADGRRCFAPDYSSSTSLFQFSESYFPLLTHITRDDIIKSL